MKIKTGNRFGMRTISIHCARGVVASISVRTLWRAPRPRHTTKYGHWAMFQREKWERVERSGLRARMFAWSAEAVRERVAERLASIALGVAVAVLVAVPFVSLFVRFGGAR